jgi:hypothetical protein
MENEGPGSRAGAGAPGAGAPDAGGDAPATSAPGPSSRALILGITAAVVVVAVVIIVVVVGMSGATDPLSPGSASATITWTSAAGNDNPPQPFTGTIDGLSVSGVATIGTLSGSAITDPTSLHAQPVRLFEYRGTFDGKAFDLGVYVLFPESGALAVGTVPAFTIRGTYDSNKVAAKLFVSRQATSLSSVPFRGTIGDRSVSGTLRMQSGSGKVHRATATYTLTG